MEVKSFRASTLRRALKQVQSEFGPDASVIRTREVWDGWLGGMMGKRRVEVFASASSELETKTAPAEESTVTSDLGVDLSDASATLLSPADHSAPEAELPLQMDRLRIESGLGNESDSLQASAKFQVFAELLEADWNESEARQMVARAAEAAGEDVSVNELRTAIHRSISDVVRVHGPIRLESGRRRVVALVGPTGVGKTTTIAKLAANFRLRENKKVALVTVDTYRIAAVEQLRTYAEIIDLPMHVVATPSEMTAAMSELTGYDLVLLDTAGRSPHDEIRLQELKGILGAAGADEVHLVLSATTGARALRRTAEKFSEVGLSALLLTKLDESVGLSDVLPLLQECDLPISYVTNGQNVPDDIQDARLADLPGAILGARQAA